jgi:serine/threonine protein kinase
VPRFTENEVLRERYRLIRHLGQGGYGSVWLAEDTTLGGMVAVKRLSSGLFPEDRKADVLQEARKAARLRGKPNIIQIFDVIEDEDESLIVMEYASGGTLDDLLRQRVKKGKWLETREAVDLTKGILEGIRAAHGHADGCIIHRDLKPVNILLAGPVPKIVDFGIAAIGTVDRLPTAALRNDRGHVGSPFFMSPEQLRGTTLDHRSDLFNVGLIAFLLLGRRHPFADEALLFHYRELVLDGVRPIPRLIAGPMIVHAFQKWLLCLLQLREEDRYCSAEEALLEFEECERLWSGRILAAALELEGQIRKLLYQPDQEQKEELMRFDLELLAQEAPKEIQEDLADFTAGEVAEAISLCRKAGYYPQSVLLYERGGFEFSSLPEHIRQKTDEDYGFCKRRHQQGGAM